MNNAQQSLSDELRNWRNFEECLIHDVSPKMFGYGLDLIFSYVWDGDHVRENVLDVPRLVTLRLLGVESVQFVGGLTPSMRQNPDSLNWGLTEIARVTQIPSSLPVGIAVEWEGPRRLTVECDAFELLASNAT